MAHVWNFLTDSCANCGVTAEQIWRQQMSTSWTYSCDSHNPPLAADSDGWASRYTLEEDIKRRDLINTIPEFVWVESELDIPRHYRWLRFHSDCKVSLVSEHGEVAVTIPAKDQP